MAKKGKISSKVVGLDIGLIIGRFFLDTEDLHYGYWPEGMEATIHNLVKAQENHSRLIMEHIPKGTERILDVGSGSGNLALKLINKGYKVDCVIPSKYLAENAQIKLGKTSKIYDCRFEDLSTDETYDLILFSESFQYVKMMASLQKVADMLKKDGHLLICDFFRLKMPTKSPLGGGHRWLRFQDAVSTNFRKVTDLDITNETAPTIAIVAEFNREVVAPSAEMIRVFLTDNYPRISAFMRWKFKRPIERLNRTYLSGEVNEENFKKFKTYRLLLFQRT
jgi:2-polyprenyl-3-methyl-5-hydroxy-6-metoxy-1,4-benzoquinol methylase